MGKYLRIKNRGECPRIFLTLLGATTKNDRMGDVTQGGWFGSGTKYAPIAALNLGIAVAVTSRDDGGGYLMRYTVEEKALSPGRVVQQVILNITAHDGSRSSVPTAFTLDACKNWKEPIGDDGMKAFRVLREYLRNAVDADPEGFVIEEVDACEWPAKGWTHVYLSASSEIRAMLRAPERYFKYVDPDVRPPLAHVGNGTIYPRSDPDRTRLFSLGTLAFCSADARLRSRHDYSINVKFGHQGRPLLTEERTFSELSLVYIEIKKMLASWKDAAALTDLLMAMMAGEASLEAQALQYYEPCDKPAAPEWLEAWRRVYGAEAVISSNPYADEWVRYTSGGRIPVAVPLIGLRNFLMACGVKEAAECVPGMVAGQEFRPVVELEDWEIERLVIARKIMHEEFPESRAYGVQVFEPLTERMRGMLGFAACSTKPPALYVQRACLRSWDTLIATLVVHECRHGRTGVDDAKREFVDRADRDIANLLMDKHGLPHEPEPKVKDIALLSVIPAKP